MEIVPRRGSGGGAVDFAVTDDAEDIEDRAELLVRGAGPAKLLGHFFDPLPSGLDVTAIVRSARGHVSARFKGPVALGLLGLQRLGAHDRGPELVLGSDQAAMEIGLVLLPDGSGFAPSGRLGQESLELSPFVLEVPPLPSELIPDGADLLAEFVVAPGRRLRQVPGLLAMPLFGHSQQELGLDAACVRVVTLPGQGLDLLAGGIGLAADSFHLLVQGGMALFLLSAGGLESLAVIAQLDLMVVFLPVEPGLQLPDLRGQFVVAPACLLGSLFGMVHGLDQPGDFGL